MKSFFPLFKISVCTLIVSFAVANNPISEPHKNDHPPFKMFSQDMLEKGEWGYDPETNSGWFGIRENEIPQGECVTPGQEAEIVRRLDENIAHLRQRGILPETPSRVPTDFTWPLEPTENFTANDYWAISGFVDHDPTTNWEDHLCYGRTYNGHNGTDYYLWPHQFNMMDNEEVAIVAAAPGTIIEKDDGNYDRRCSWGGFQWNAVYILHDDGSTAWYGHMKTNSLTEKWVGDTVERGEYLGMVGSSGNSMSPHLHFEVRDENGVVVDPYEGPCNDIDESHWEDQHPYRETALQRGGTYGAVSWWMDCPQPSILNYRNHFMNNEYGYLVGYFRDVLQGNPIYYQRVNPNGQVDHLTTIYSDGDYTSFWWWWGGMFVDDTPPGEYAFRVLLNGEAHDFPFYWEMSGCTDPTADNYDPDAVIDNGTCYPCNTGSEVKISFDFDNYPDETFWTLNDADNVNNYMSGGYLVGSSDTYCASPGTYQVTVYDTYGDGMCCEFGEGGYSIYVDNVLVAEGGDFLYEDVTAVVIDGESTGIVETQYSPNWNMVGLPVEAEDLSYETLFPNAYLGTLYSFSGGYTQEELLETGTGYWLRLQEASTVEFAGGLFSEISVPVVGGWNIVSGPSEDASLEDPDGLVFDGTVYGFDGSYVNSNVFEPGKGYWVRSSGDGTITLFIGGPEILGREKQSSSMRDQYIYQSSKVRFSNAEGNTIELYVGSKIPEEDIPMFSVPPLPPANGFDVRFATDTKYCSTNECMVEVMTNGQPLTLECEMKNSELWELVDGNGNVYECDGVHEIELDGNSESLVLKEIISTQFPTEFALFPAHPNPFNPITNIQFSVPELSEVILSIYDIQGRLIETLLTGQNVPGNHMVQWNATQFSSGVYFVELKGNKKRIIQKIIFMK